MSANDMTVEALLRAHAPHAPESLARARVRARAEAAAPAEPAAAAARARRAAGRARDRRLGGRRARHRRLGLVDADRCGSSTLAGRTCSAAEDTAVAASLASSSAQRRIAPRARPRLPCPRASRRRRRLVRAPAAHRRVDPAQREERPTSSRRRRRARRASRRRSAATRSPSTTARREPSVIDLRIPTQNVKTALSRLAGLGTIVSQELSVTDLQQQFETQSAQIAQLRRRIAALRTAIQRSVARRRAEGAAPHPARRVAARALAAHSTPRRERSRRGRRRPSRS